MPRLLGWGKGYSEGDEWAEIEPAPGATVIGFQKNVDFSIPTDGQSFSIRWGIRSALCGMDIRATMRSASARNPMTGFRRSHCSVKRGLVCEKTAVRMLNSGERRYSS